jgi:glycine/D-amino acid oxidase-like deaminating enzyme
MSARADVAVVGAGIVGAAVARELAVRGVAVVLLDRGEVSSGTTGRGEGNVLVSDKDAGPELGLTLAGLRVYAELEERLGDEARIRRKGALVVHTDAGAWDAEPERVARLGVPASLVASDELRRLEPALTGAALGATHVPGDLQCDARAITRALVREAEAAGAEVRTGCPVGAVELAGGAVRGLRTSEGLLAARAVVLAAGTWTAPLAASAGLSLPLEPRKGQLVRLLAPQRGFIRHKVLDGAYLGAVASPDAGLQLAPVVETTWEGDVLVGSSRERRGFDTTVDPTVSHAIVERAAALFPSLRALPVADAWAGLRPWLPDRLPAIGPSAVVAGLWLATGHEGAGVALGPVTGRLVAQLYCGEAPVVDPAPFAPDRFAGRG